MRKYNVEFVLGADHSKADTILRVLGECGENVEVAALPQSQPSREQDLKVQILTIDPTLVFDMCAEYGRIKSAKIEESA